MPSVKLRSRRAGATLVELSIALLLGGISAAIGGGLLLAAERRARRDANDDRAAQTVRDVGHVLGSELASARWGATVFRGDTAIDVDSHIGVSVVCTTGARELVLPSARTSLRFAFTHYRQVPEASDLLLVWDTLSGGWHEATIESVGFRGDGAGCPASGVFRTPADSVAREPVAVIRLDAALPTGVGAGSPVRIVRNGRWLIYRGTDRLWWLGYRRCPAGVCGAPQPVAGPLEAPSGAGLLVGPGPDGTVDLVVTPLGSTGAPPFGRRRMLAVRGAVHAKP